MESTAISAVALELSILIISEKLGFIIKIELRNVV
jgi:hypothetical protein